MSSNSPIGPLTTLANIILAQAQLIDAAYATHPSGPLHSLSDPIYPYTSHPLEKDAEIKKSVLILSAAAEQLVYSVKDPLKGLLDGMLDSCYHPVAMNVVEKHHVADILKAKSGAMHVNDIAKEARIKDPSKLDRVLRYLSTKHIFKEVKPNIWANNRISSALVKKQPLEQLCSQPHLQYTDCPGAAVVSLTHHQAFLPLQHFDAWFHADPPNETGLPSSDDTLVTPYELTHGRPLWKIYKEDELASRRFETWLSAYGNDDRVVLRETLQYLDPKADDLIVDVGGGTGTLSLVLARERPDLRHVVQDQAEVIDNARQFWVAEAPEIFGTGRIKLEVHDSFTPQPTNNASVYILRNILHDWSRSHSIRIMKHLSHAAKNYLSQIAGAQCRLVILEAIVPSPSPSLPFEEVLIPDDVPKELLPSLGGVVARYDLWMGTSFNGQERSISEFIELGEESGWGLDHVLPGDRVNALIFGLVQNGEGTQ
ncbi:S-adenosyl-L-methionine-dependent methyltransferase [Pterulicium gracile]|uniref:S-adenosyl-L-methionine-dependent methyltransferase n=1 Tax=Pterulicium gracile TaxID=1884261 RepID=A0A5C3QLM0_9AGAR|nr:S-adenosyl-L-methionine-dependent methyltransferase [Pterula gracilis]